MVDGLAWISDTLFEETRTREGQEPPGLCSESERRIKGKKTDPDRFAESETLTLASLPCWSHLSPEATGLASQSSLIRSKPTQRPNERPRAASPSDSRPSCGRIRGPSRTKKSPAPRFHVVRKWVRKELYQTYTLFVQAYREAVELLRSGNRTAVFPRGCFPPPLPFVA